MHQRGTVLDSSASKAHRSPALASGLVSPCSLAPRPAAPSLHRFVQGTRASAALAPPWRKLCLPRRERVHQKAPQPARCSWPTRARTAFSKGSCSSETSSETYTVHDRFEPERRETRKQLPFWQPCAGEAHSRAQVSWLEPLAAPLLAWVVRVPSQHDRGSSQVSCLSNVLRCTHTLPPSM